MIIHTRVRILENNRAQYYFVKHTGLVPENLQQPCNYADVESISTGVYHKKLHNSKFYGRYYG